MNAIVSCPTCKKEVRWDASSKWRPFCSERCRLIDLGEWFDEKHRISDKEKARTFLPAGDPYSED